MSKKEKFLEQALQLSLAERADIVDQLLKSLDQPDEQIEALWKDEAEDRIEAYEAGKIRSVSLQDDMYWIVESIRRGTMIPSPKEIGWILGPRVRADKVVHRQKIKHLQPTSPIVQFYSSTILQRNSDAMTCVICKTGTMKPGHVTVTLERQNSIIIVKNVPASVCENCGEYTLDDATTERVMQIAEEAIAHNVEVEVLQYAAWLFNPFNHRVTQRDAQRFAEEINI